MDKSNRQRGTSSPDIEIVMFVGLIILATILALFAMGQERCDKEKCISAYRERIAACAKDDDFCRHEALVFRTECLAKYQP